MRALIRWGGAFLLVGLLSSGWLQDQWILVKASSSEVNGSEVVQSIHQWKNVDAVCIKHYWAMCHKRMLGQKSVMIELWPKTIVGKWQDKWVTQEGSLLDEDLHWFEPKSGVMFIGQEIDFVKLIRLVFVFGSGNTQSVSMDAMGGVEMVVANKYTLKLGRKNLLMRAKSAQKVIEAMVQNGSTSKQVLDMRYSKGFSLKKLNS
ncbi:MAG TPA: hypothetical protein QF353_02365 [Gammaproteobacteria bacterium]|nr:hypothetical protein [Gammaproteobacteria bacterium]